MSSIIEWKEQRLVDQHWNLKRKAIDFYYNWNILNHLCTVAVVVHKYIL